ncbi:hypothetical protein CW751_01255 [Brumimicrobium salinarum]|uniref:CAAX prenyl protease 2/Lysostaphin resistance protein A-like domain-containing protein n=1 Tax=Brumimicrobium salinarum TaxID=2058658 RepID=A0A2I0R5Y6_9FLAO|nr:type II CAAX endopeptidase family protein [Brumimicrobium salinarum]PKR81994.1 hypothetical protein CW751_01255 [Brumimicrobium salinarum]
MMKDKFNSISPFQQALALFAIGFVAFVTLSMLVSVVISTFYPQIPTDQIALQRENYPIAYMLIHFLPFQVGFLLVPGLVYMRWFKTKINPTYATRFPFVIWSILLFIVAFMLLPFLADLNAVVLKWIGMYTDLTAQKNMADEQLKTLIGTPFSITYFTAMLIVAVITGIAEEFAFRRFLFHHMYAHTKNLKLSILSSAFIFALLHFNYLQMLPIFTFGVVLALIYHVSGSIIPGMLLHGLNNGLNIHWLSTDSTPIWLNSSYIEITIPSVLLLMGLIIYYLKKIKPTAL